MVLWAEAILRYFVVVYTHLYQQYLQLKLESGGPKESIAPGLLYIYEPLDTTPVTFKSFFLANLEPDVSFQQLLTT